jgi:beta-N-acetylhexosaminidase
VSRKRYTSLVLAVILLLGLSPPLLAQQPHQDGDAAERLLARMPPAARVGQLFMVTFSGTDTDELSAIYNLVMEQRIGGVLLRPGNGNIVNEGDTPAQVGNLCNRLQQLAYDATRVPLPSRPGSESETALAPYVPLFVAVEQSGDGSPYTAIVNGATPLPSPMAIGATWNPSHAETVGSIVGAELSAMGVNMLLGPPLDVLNSPRPSSPADLAVHSFGGDPYWVGQMGTAYIRGVHAGSTGRVAAIATHFPGLGAADRPLSEEVATVQKSLEQLKQIELAPFFAVAGSEDVAAQADGFLVTHIRYRGFQGNIYASTRPVSFDPQALQQLMLLPELAPWRQAGGLTVSDELGVRAVRRFYDPTEQEFNHLRIAREAFLAGNDLLILSHFALGDDWESHVANIRATAAFFLERYNSDPSFQAQVDAAVLRILRLKMSLYGESLSFLATQIDEEAAGDLVGQQREQVARIARDAVTLLSPLSPDLRPAPPASDDWIVVFTDDRQVSPCAGCDPVYAIPPTALEDTLVRFYGPGGTHQVQPSHVESYTFGQLLEYLEAPAPPPTEEGASPTPQPLADALARADWVMFAMLDITERVPGSDAVRHFLAEQANLLLGKQVVVFAFGAPYYLDTTEIAKLAAYFALYSHTEPFVEAAARALFEEFPLTGVSPVSVSGISYDLIVRTQPDPAQIIQLFIGPEPEEADGTPQPTVQPRYGETLLLRTSLIVDRNGYPVPDGTPVEFTFSYPQEGLEHTIQTTTRSGVAQASVTLDRVGQLQISVRAEPVPRAVRLELDVQEGGPAVIVSVTSTPSPTPRPAPTSTPPPTQEVTPGSAQQPDTDGTSALTRDRVSWLDLALSLGGTTVIALAGYAGRWRRRRERGWALRAGLWCAVGGLGAYIGSALGLPGANWVRAHAGVWAASLVSSVGAIVTLAAVLVADWAGKGRRRPQLEHEG